MNALEKIEAVFSELRDSWTQKTEEKLCRLLYKEYHDRPESELDARLKSIGEGSRGEIDFKFIYQKWVNKKKKELKRQGKDSPWWSNGKFIPSQLGHHIMSKNHFIWGYGSVCFFNGKHYQAGASAFIKKKVSEILSDAWSNHRTMEVSKWILNKVTPENPYDTPTLLDTDTDIINFQNGVLNWREMKFYGHSPSFYSSILMGVDYEPGAESDEFNTFLEQILFPQNHSNTEQALKDYEEVETFIYELIGWLLIPHPYLQKMVLFLGAGSNGKSLLLEIIENLIGKQNISNIALHDLCTSSFARARLSGKLMNVLTDISGAPLMQTDTLKNLVDGSGIHSEKKHETGFDLHNKARFVFSCNSLPRSFDTSYGFYRRLIILRFPNKFTESNSIPFDSMVKKLTKKDIACSIINKSISGLRNLIKRGYFNIPRVCQIEKENYQKQNESWRSFVEYHCILDEGHTATTELFDQYKIFCLQSGLKHVSNRKFYEKIMSTYPQVTKIRKRVDGIMYPVDAFSGIRIKAQGEC